MTVVHATNTHQFIFWGAFLSCYPRYLSSTHIFFVTGVPNLHPHAITGSIIVYRCQFLCLDTLMVATRAAKAVNAATADGDTESLADDAAKDIPPDIDFVIANDPDNNPDVDDAAKKGI